jgi:ribosomal protein L37AE/L43A
MNTANKTIKMIIAAASISLFSLTSFAANPAGPMPKCPKGQIPKMEMGQWQCKALGLSSGPNNAQRGGVNVAAGDVNGDGAASNPAGDRPKCPKGQLPKLENGMWQCKEPGITSKPDGNEALLLPAVQKVREAAAR